MKKLMIATAGVLFLTLFGQAAQAGSLEVGFQQTLASEEYDRVSTTYGSTTPARYFHISVNPNNAGYGSYIALNDTNDGVIPPYTRTFSGPVLAWSFVGGGTNGDLSISEESGGLISWTTTDQTDPITNTFDSFGQNQKKFWNATDPGPDFNLPSNEADEGTTTHDSTATGYRSFGQATATIDVSGLASGTANIFYGAFSATPVVDAVLRDTDGGAPDIVLADLHLNGKSAWRTEFYVAEVNFTTAGGYDTIVYNYLQPGDDGKGTGSGNGRSGGIVLTGAAATGFAVTSITPDADPVNLTLTWESQAGMLYDIVGTTDPSADPQVWNPVVSDIAATTPENTEVFTKPGDAFTAFAVIEKPLPPLFEDDFETDKGWTVGVDGGTDTAWERGTPSVIGPPAANSPVNCYGTNIDAKYGLDVNVYLRSPAIDLSGATAATLSFQQFHDIEVQWDGGAVRVLRAGDLTQLGADVLNPVDGTITEWTEFSGALPAEALGENIILEFRFTSDNVEPLAQAGWYIDDVSVTVE